MHISNWKFSVNKACSIRKVVWYIIVQITSHIPLHLSMQLFYDANTSIFVYPWDGSRTIARGASSVVFVKIFFRWEPSILATSMHRMPPSTQKSWLLIQLNARPSIDSMFSDIIVFCSTSSPRKHLTYKQN